MNEPPELRERIDLPIQVKQAKESDDLVLFIGAGISKLLDVPLWGEFAEKVLEDLREKKCFDYSDIEQLTGFLNPRQILSIAKSISETKRVELKFEKYFEKKAEPGSIYDTIKDIKCVYVTTNYDGLFPSKNSSERVYGQSRIDFNLLNEQGKIIHLHGYKDEPDTMIVTMKDYLKCYSEKKIQDFLKYLFDIKTVVFFGYGLEDIEILEHIFRRGDMKKTTELRRFAVTGFFRSQSPLYKNLYAYYQETFGVRLLGFAKDQKDYKAVEDIIRDWANQMKTADLYEGFDSEKYDDPQRIKYEDIEYMNEVFGDE